MESCNPNQQLYTLAKNDYEIVMFKCLSRGPKNIFLRHLLTLREDFGDPDLNDHLMDPVTINSYSVPSEFLSLDFNKILSNFGYIDFSKLDQKLVGVYLSASLIE